MRHPVASRARRAAARWPWSPAAAPLASVEPRLVVSDGAPGTDATKVGFIFVGPKDDFGYNQAAYEGAQAVRRGFPDLEVLTAENVPEDDNAARIMERMIDKGAKIIFATSYGHLDPPIRSPRPPRRRRRAAGQLHQGDIPPNTGTYFGTRVRAGVPGRHRRRARPPRRTSSATSTPSRSRRRSPTSTPSRWAPQTVNPTSRSSPSTPRTGATRPSRPSRRPDLLGQGVDVITQHQDCTATIIKAAEAAGRTRSGYHADASALAPEGLAHRLGVELGRRCTSTS